MSQSVVFGYQTALQIVRSLGIERLSECAVEGLPGTAPSRMQLLEAVETLASLHPDLHPTYPLHYLIDDGARPRATKLSQPHSCSKQLPAQALLTVADGIYAAAPPLAFVQENCRRGFYDSIELGDELCGSFQSSRCGLPALYNIPSFVSTEELRAFAACNQSIHGSRKALQALAYVADGSASARESKLALVLGLPTSRGGGGLGIPCFNHEVVSSPTAYAMTGKHTLRCDLHYPGTMIDIEYQSKEFHDEDEEHESDDRRVKGLMSMDYTVLGITMKELDSYLATDLFVQLVRQYLDRPQLRTRLDDYHARKLLLRMQLGLLVGND